MSATENIDTGSVITFLVQVNNSKISYEERILSIYIEKGINRISTARIKLLDGDSTTGKFEASSSSDLVPGAKISIQAGYESKNKLIFKGIITKQAIKIDKSIGSTLTLECRDEAVKMIVGRKSLTFSKKTDSDIISSIIGKYSGLSSSVTSTTTEWPEQVQYYATDWDYILARSEANGLFVTTINGKITVQKPDAETSPVLKVVNGDNLLEFQADLNSVSQLKSAKANAWDYKTQEVISGEASNTHSGSGSSSSEDLAEVVDLSDFVLQTSASLQEDSLNNWAKAEMIKSEYSKIQGQVSFKGSNLVEPGKYFTIDGVGTRFNGNHLISSVTHDISNGNWVSEASFGLSPRWFTEEPDVMAPSASGLLPGACGLFNATVKKMYEDPDNQLRILIDIPLFDKSGEGLWARLSNFYSTSGAGAFFLPEVGDEVVIGFLNEDPRYPIILGSLYSSSKNKPFEGLTPDEKNTIKAIVSKSGINIKFDDENKVLTFTTPNNNMATFSDKDKQIKSFIEHTQMKFLVSVFSSLFSEFSD